MMRFIPQIVFVILPLLWLLSAARAAVVVTAFPQALVLVDLDTIQGSQLPVDLNSDGTVDFTIAYQTSQFLGLRTEGLNRLAVELAPPPNIGGSPIPFSPGDILGPNLQPFGEFSPLWYTPVDPDDPSGFRSFFTLTLTLSTGSSSVFSWDGERVLLGVEFHAADGVHYGYLDVWGTRRYAGLNLYGWAYETEPGVPITTAFVPEPSVSLLALGMAGGLLGRRRP